MGERWRLVAEPVVLAKGKWRAPAAQPRGADPRRQRRCYTMAAPKLCAIRGNMGELMGWRLVAVGGAAGSMAVAANACDNGDQQRGQR